MVAYALGVQWQSNQMGANQRAVGEEGYVTSLSEAGDDAWITVELSGSYTEPPVIVAGLPTHHNEQEVAVRVKDIRLGDGTAGCVAGAWCFDIRLQEVRTTRLLRAHLQFVLSTEPTLACTCQHVSRPATLIAMTRSK